MPPDAPLRLAIAAAPDAARAAERLAARLAAAGAGRIEARAAAVRGPADLAALGAWAGQGGLDGVLWVEGCAPLLAAPPGRDGARPRILLRLAGAEAHDPARIQPIDWTAVERLVVPGADQRRALAEVRPGIEELVPITILPPGLEPAPAVAAARVPFRLGWWGPIAAARNPLIALAVLHHLRRAEPRWHLRIAGGTGERAAVEAFLHQAGRLGLGDAIGFDGAIPPGEAAAWHARNLALLSTGLQEGIQVVALQAALAGCDLAVLDHPGAAEFLPRVTLFALPEEAAALIAAAAPDRWQGDLLARFPAEAEASAILALVAAPPRHAAAAPPEWSATYWDRRYLAGGDSGAGSFGRLARFKARVVNGIVAQYGIASVLEFGCGDGNQLALADYPAYVGVDVSAAAVAACRRRFAEDATKRFLLSGAADPGEADLVLSLDVIYHLIEDRVFEAHMRALFAHARRMVAIYASDTDAPGPAPHVRHRRFSTWIARHAPAWERVVHIPNPYPYDPARPTETSFADFHLYARRDAAEAAMAA